MNKTVLRKKYISVRNGISDRVADTEIISSEKMYKDANVIFCYVSTGSEIGTIPLLKKIASEKILTVPYCIDSDGHMAAVRINSLNELNPGRFGIYEPINQAEYDKSLIDLAIIPGVAFDKRGFRLGYGKGYYDRFLRGTTIKKIGICHRELFVSSLPCDDYDIPMDKVLIF